MRAPGQTGEEDRCRIALCDRLRARADAVVAPMCDRIGTTGAAQRGPTMRVERAIAHRIVHVPWHIAQADGS